MSDLTKIPGIGKNMEKHLINIGYPDIESLKGQDAEEIYMKHCIHYAAGNQSCKCVLYCYRLAVHYADHNGELPPDKQNWNDWKDPKLGGVKMDRPTKPYEEIKAMLGIASPAWEKLVGHIRYYYEIDEIWAEGKPTHKHYNLLFFKRSGKSLITLCLREGFFLVSITLGAKEREKFEEQRETFGAAVYKEYDKSETLHDGKWLGFEVRDDSLIPDIIRLLPIKRKPNRKVLPESIEKCGQLDIGLSHGEITKSIL